MKGRVEEIHNVRYRTREEIVSEMERRGIPRDVIDRLYPRPPALIEGEVIE